MLYPKDGYPGHLRLLYLEHLLSEIRIEEAKANMVLLAVGMIVVVETEVEIEL